MHELFSHSPDTTLTHTHTHTGEIIIPNDKYRMEEIDVNTYTTRLRLHLRLSTSADEGGYKCCSKNSIGDSEGTITVYGKLYCL